MRTLASPCYGGIYHRFRTECGSSRQLRAGTELYRLGLWTIRVHRQILLEAVKHIPEYTGLVVLTVMLLLVPLIWQAVKSTDYRFRYPGIVLAWSFGLYATGYTPSLYSLGHAGLSRTLNAVKITYFMLLFLNEIYWCGWLRQVLKKEQRKPHRSCLHEKVLRSGGSMGSSV